MGRRLSSEEESQNIKQLGDFRSFWMHSPEYPQKNFGNDHVRYPVEVVYTYADGRSKIEFYSEFCAFIGAGPEDGRVDIEDTTKVRIEEFHLQFSPAFQKYIFDKTDRSLIISDISPKMGGKYEVRIKPSIEEP